MRLVLGIEEVFVVEVEDGVGVVEGLAGFVVVGVDAEGFEEVVDGECSVVGSEVAQTTGGEGFGIVGVLGNPSVEVSDGFIDWEETDLGFQVL